MLNSCLARNAVDLFLTFVKLVLCGFIHCILVIFPHLPQNLPRYTHSLATQLCILFKKNHSIKLYAVYTFLDVLSSTVKVTICFYMDWCMGITPNICQIYNHLQRHSHIHVIQISQYTMSEKVALITISPWGNAMYHFQYNLIIPCKTSIKLYKILDNLVTYCLKKWVVVDINIQIQICYKNFFGFIISCGSFFLSSD